MALKALPQKDFTILDKLGDRAAQLGGVDPQALKVTGQLVENFLIVPAPNALHVCNAPSPAATASLEIGKAIADQLPESF